MKRLALPGLAALAVLLAPSVAAAAPAGVTWSTANSVATGDQDTAAIAAPAH
jgi:hypothetical protein